MCIRDRFGRHIAIKLHELRHQVMAVDWREECVEAALPYVTSAQIGDSKNEEFMASLGVRNFDVCIVAIGDDFQSSLETTSLLKDLGARFVVAREKQLAAWTAIRYSSDHIFDYIELNADHAIVEVAVPEGWAGRTVGDLDVRRKYGLNVLAVKRQGKMNANVASDTMLLRDETVLVLGSNQAIQRCFHL